MGGVSAARYLAMTGIFVAMYLLAVRLTDVPFRPALLMLVLLGGLALGVALAQLHGGRPAQPGRLSGVGRVVSRSTMVGLAGAGLVLAQNLNEARAEWLFLGMCAMTASAAGYVWRREGRLTHRD